MLHTSHAPPHAAPRARIVGSTAREESYRGKNCPACPPPFLGLAQQRVALMCGPGPGAPVGVQKEGYTFCTPITVHGQSEPRAPPHKARQGSGARVRPKLKRTRTTPRPRPRRAKGTKRTPPARSLPGDGSSNPGKTLAAATRPAPTEQITLESTAPKGQGFGRHPRGGMQIFVKTFKIRYALRRRQPLAGSQPRKTTRPPASALPGMTAGASARPLPGPRQGPCRGHPQGHHQAHTDQTSTTACMQLPTQPARQAPAWRHADLREDPPLHHLSCLPTYVASQASLARARVNTRRSSDGRD